MQINLNNIEEVIFHDREAQKLFPEFAPNFDQWRLAQRIPGLKQMGKRAVLDVLNGLKGEQIEKLEKYLDDSIILDSIDERIVINKSATLDELEGELCEIAGFQDFCLYRDRDQVHISFWR
jgi:hypothetical protein